MSRMNQKGCDTHERAKSGIESNSTAGGTIKNQVGDPMKQQVHRKSERRRVTRDIFLVFEEPRRNRRSQGTTTKKRQARPKSKFGHLNAEDFNKTKGFLRDVKNEPRCYLRTTCQAKDTNSGILQSKNDDLTSAVDICDDSSSNKRVNPIFLWVKQDDTRIVEVRCEDYDKKNRIRITKTTNGWRAIPRTDPSSSRVVKFFQTPLLKVKREVYLNQINEKCNISNSIKEFHIEPKENDIASTKVNKIVEPMLLSSPSQRNLIKNNSQKKKDKLKEETPNVDNFQDSVTNFANMVEKQKNDGIAEVKVPESSKNLDNISEIIQFNNNIPKGGIENIEEAIDANTYQVQNTHTTDLQLCPKTGFFLPCTTVGDLDIHVSCDGMSITKELVDLVNCDVEYNKQQEISLDNLDVEAKKLKDLLDDADLLQHCGDNVNNGAEIIDSLVKRSCEDNLIQETDVLKTAGKFNEDLSTVNDCNLAQRHLVTENVPQISEAISEPPKSLSFNEAGEIEGLNGELFQSNHYGTFDKECIVQKELDQTSIPNTIEIITLDTSSKLLSCIEDVPKDLSYKKREEVCPPSESRSQCAVTSTSDTLKSPIKDGLPAIESASESIKNLILEQVLKLNTLSAASESNKSHQSEPIDFGKCRTPSRENSANKRYSPDCASYIETVVVDENSNDEPVKKRLRGSVPSEKRHSNLEIGQDPDPLTQLQLLIKNTQWKVPDPILVPKDRLGAVLASPAREIPLLITTRPELRLPEAFAHPEIIQNPNILVISMAQLEAILKSEVETEYSKSRVCSKEVNKTSVRKTHRQEDEKVCTGNMRLEEPIKTVRKCAHVESNLASDINAATLAVLNQMLWLPYFGKLSEEFFASLKTHVNSNNKYPTNILPFCNSQLGLQHLDGLYNNYIKQLSQIKNLSLEASNHRTDSFSNTISNLQNPVDLTILQKIVENQMRNFFNVNNSFPTDVEPEQSPVVNHSSNEPSSNTVINTPNTNFLSHNRITKPNINTNLLPCGVVDQNSSDKPPEKYLCVNKRKDETSCEGIVEAVELHKFTRAAKHISDNRPRLTCKSLSNLLEPENKPAAALPMAAFSPTADAIRSSCESGSNKINISVKNLGKEPKYALERGPGTTFKTSRSENVNLLLNSYDISAQKKGINMVESGVPGSLGKNSDDLSTSDSNAALWHPLFRSNTKSSYSSPWQWTTVTATGE